MMNFSLHLGDCLEVLKNLDDNSIDSIVSDPPYGISFMGKKWDYDVPSKEIWEECLRVLKPGGYLVAFAGSKTQHRMAIRIEDAGFEVVDVMIWSYASGFPKSHNVANNIDKMYGASTRGKAIPVASTNLPSGKYAEEKLEGNKVEKYVARTPHGEPWVSWGTALKPAIEPITLAKKPGPSILNLSGKRVFFHSKAAKKDRNEGVKDEKENNHPTVKPVALMAELCHTITPKGGTILDPFMGSGSTGKAAIANGFSFVGIEREQEYLDIARMRIQHTFNKKQQELF